MFLCPLYVLKKLFRKSSHLESHPLDTFYSKSRCRKVRMPSNGTDLTFDDASILQVSGSVISQACYEVKQVCQLQRICLANQPQHAA